MGKNDDEIVLNINKSDEAEQLYGMLSSNRENIRMKCLEAALTYCEITKTERVTRKQVIDLAEDFYKFVKGE